MLQPSSTTTLSIKTLLMILVQHRMDVLTLHLVEEASANNPALQAHPPELKLKSPSLTT